MRELTIKQKTLLTKWFKEKCPSKKEYRFFDKMPTLLSFEDLSSEQIDILEKINNTEILYQNVNRFLSDLNMNWGF